MFSVAKAGRGLAVLFACVLLLGAAPTHAGAGPTVTPVPIVDGPPETRSTPFLAW